MNNISVGYISVRQPRKIDTKIIKIKEFIKQNKIGLIIGGISFVLFSTYAVLIINFINLIKIMY